MKLNEQCCRCDNKAIRVWYLPGIKEKYYLCQNCLILMLELNLRWLKESHWHNKMIAYEAKFDKKVYTTHGRKK